MGGGSDLRVGKGYRCSGCLAVSVAVHAEETTIHAQDISTAAINVARANAERHGWLSELSFTKATLSGVAGHLLV